MNRSSRVTSPSPLRLIAEKNVVCFQAFRLVAEADHLTRRRVHFRVRGEGEFSYCWRVPVRADGLKRVAVDFVGQTVFLQREKFPREGERRGVLHRAVEPRHAGIVRERVAIFAEKLLPRGAVGLVPRRFDPAAFVIHHSVLEAKHVDVTVHVEWRIVFEFRRVEPVAAQANERTVQVRGNFADHFAVVNVRLEARRREKPLHCGLIRKVNHGRSISFV